MKQLKAYKFRIYPNEEQKIFFSDMIPIKDTYILSTN